MGAQQGGRSGAACAQPPARADRAQGGSAIASIEDIPAYSETDLLAAGLLPSGWAQSIAAAVDRAAHPALLQGGTSTSLEPADTNIAYRLLDGAGVQAELPWLDALYRGHLAELATRSAGGPPMAPSAGIESGVNVNALDGPGVRYELHYDSNPLTGLLFVTGHDRRTGGQLLFKLPERDIVIDPRPGLFITFDARTLPHAVTPLITNSTRLSVVMNFYPEGEFSRPDGLDAYLYRNNRSNSRPKGN